MFSALLAVLVMSALRSGSVVLRWVGGNAAIMLIWIGARLLAATWFEIAPALALLALVAVLRLVLLTNRVAERGRRIDAESGLPNLMVLDARRDADATHYFIPAQIDDFDSLKLAVGAENLGELRRRLSERLQVAGSATAIYRTDDRTLVWSTPLSMSELEPQLAGLRAVMCSLFDVAGRRLGVSLTFGVAPVDASAAPDNAVHAASLAKRSGKPWRLHVAG